METVKELAKIAYTKGYRSKSKVFVKTPEGISIRKKQLKDELADLLLNNNHLELFKEFSNSRNDLTNAVMDQLAVIKTRLEERKNSERVAANVVTTEYNAQTLLSDCGIAKDIITAEDFVYRKSTGHVLPDSVESVLTGLNKTEKDFELSQIVLSRLYYNPYDERPFYKGDHRGAEVIYFNSYFPPKWKSYKEETDAPLFFIKLMEHLIPDKGARNYTYQWLKQTLIGRNETVLTLIGNNGIGKNILASKILTALLGKRNSMFFGEAFFTSRFNGELENKSLIVFDEVVINNYAPNRKKDRIKELCNDYITVEKKGKEPRSVKNNANFVLINNYEDENELTPSDRRFSVIELTKVPLLDKIKQSDVSDFIELIDNDEETVASIANYLMKSISMEGFINHIPWKAKRFREVMMLSYSEWKRAIVDAIYSERAKEYDLADIRDEVKENHSFARFPGESKITSFLEKEYRDDDDEAIGKVERRNNRIIIVPSKKYLPSLAEEFNELESEDHLDIFQ